MKRILISLAAAIFAFVPLVSAQTPESRNEITLGYGRVTVVDVAHVVGGVFATAFTAGYARFDNFRSYGSVNLEYYRVLNKTFSVGAAVSWFGGTADELNKDNVKVGNADYSGFAVMPAAKVFWFRKPHVAMYSKLAAGETQHTDGDRSYLIVPVSQKIPALREHTDDVTFSRLADNLGDGTREYPRMESQKRVLSTFL